MKRSCSVCGGIHERGQRCPFAKKKKPKKRKKDTSSVAVKFRSGRDWTRKAKAVKERDNWMCQVCIKGDYPIEDDGSLIVSLNRYEGRGVIVFTELEVHHIEKVSENYEKRLDGENLITLCRTHHRMAEEGKIPKRYLQKIAEERERNNA